MVRENVVLLMKERQGVPVQGQVGVALGGGIGVLSAAIPEFSRLDKQREQREQVGGDEAQLVIGNGCFLLPESV